jgi:hypothetical protein
MRSPLDPASRNGHVSVRPRSKQRAPGPETPARIIVFPQARARFRRRIRSVAWLSALLVAAGGYVHLCLYRHGYRTIPKIGVAFLLTVIASGVLALGLVVLRGLANRLARVAGMALSAGTLVAFAISRTPAGLFNFREVGFQPSPQAALAVVTEGSALLLLLATFVMEGTALACRRVDSPVGGGRGRALTLRGFPLPPPHRARPPRRARSLPRP